MENELQVKIETIADNAGWDNYTLTKLVCEWLEAYSEPEKLVEYLSTLADEGE